MSVASVLIALRQITADGWPASVREITEATEDVSPSTTYRNLRVLERRGLAVQHPRRPIGGWKAT